MCTSETDPPVHEPGEGGDRYTSRGLRVLLVFAGLRVCGFFSDFCVCSFFFLKETCKFANLDDTGLQVCGFASFLSQICTFGLDRFAGLQVCGVFGLRVCKCQNPKAASIVFYVPNIFHVLKSLDHKAQKLNNCRWCDPVMLTYVFNICRCPC